MKITTEFDTHHNIWLAYEGVIPEDSAVVGEGKTPEAACEDFWWQWGQHHERTVSLAHVGNAVRLSDGLGLNVDFSTEGRAREYALEHRWAIK